MKLLKYLSLSFIITLSSVSIAYSKMGSSTHINYKDVKWEKGVGNSETTSLWGDSSEGRYGNLTRLKPGAGIGYHYHSNDLRAVIIKGSVYIRDRDSTKEDVLEEGSYFAKKAKVIFDVRCAFDEECVILFMQSGMLDFNFTK